MVNADIFLFVPALALVASLLDRLLDGAGLQLEDTGSSILARPLTVLPLIAFLLFFGPIPEELGWRGYALDRLQARWSAGVASLILGLVWASWHLPLFWIAGTYHQQLGVGSVRFWLYLASFLPQSVLITWVYNHTERSILSRFCCIS